VRWWLAAAALGTVAHFWLALSTQDPSWIERGGGFTAIIGAAGAAAALIAARRFDRAAAQLGGLGDVLTPEQQAQLQRKMNQASFRHQTLLILIAALGSAQQGYADWLYVAARDAAAALGL